WAVISNEDERAKPGFGGDELIPEAAIVDPEVLDEMPSDLAAVTGFDAFCHLNEAYVGDSANPMADVFAREGIERVAEYLPESVSPEDDDEKREARDEMAVADTLAGICETTSMVVATHGLAHSISAYDPSVPHGEALASVASEVAAYNVENGDEETKRRYGEVAELLGMPVADRKLDAALAVDAFDELKREIGLDVSVGDLGIDEDALGWLAEHTVEYMEMSIGNNPVDLDEEDLVEILDDAY
ncbi:MAG: iron-containing alcohol dehydrogenase, partial [Halobacteria archaeon]|nr:iron-containing alcohol dehydrogenase [Halobacteria archaeon]